MTLGAGDLSVGRLLQRLDEFAFRIIAAADELAVPAAAHNQRRFALRAAAALHHFRHLRLFVVAEATGVVALGITGTADEAPAAAEAGGERLATLGAGLVHRFLRDILTGDVLLGVVDAILEWLPECAQQWHPLFFAARHRVELVFQLGREVVINVLREIIGEEFIHHPSDIGGDETALVHRDIFARLQGRDDGGVGGRPAAAVFFQRFRQTGFRIARRRVGEVLLGADLGELDLIALGKWGQSAIVVIALAVVVAFFVYRVFVWVVFGRVGGAVVVVVVGVVFG